MADNDDARGISRRQFLKGVAVGTAAGAIVTGGGAAAAWPKGTAKPVGVPDKWDKEADVVILGTGTVSVAAIVAKVPGQKS